MKKIKLLLMFSILFSFLFILSGCVCDEGQISYDGQCYDMDKLPDEYYIRDTCSIKTVELESNNLDDSVVLPEITSCNIDENDLWIYSDTLINGVQYTKNPSDHHFYLEGEQQKKIKFETSPLEIDGDYEVIVDFGDIKMSVILTITRDYDSRIK